ncbi:glutaredoxin family protein [bacterium]|nr:glutaredoxin family protein [bacterium]
MESIHIHGKNRGNILLFALSTCGWCKKAKRLLDEMGVEYSYIDVDLTEGEERRTVENEMYSWNPRGSFPTIVINNSTTIIGFSEDEIRKKIGGTE